MIKKRSIPSSKEYSNDNYIKSKEKLKTKLKENPKKKRKKKR